MQWECSFSMYKIFIFNLKNKRFMAPLVFREFDWIRLLIDLQLPPSVLTMYSRMCTHIKGLMARDAIDLMIEMIVDLRIETEISSAELETSPWPSTSPHPSPPPPQKKRAQRATDKRLGQIWVEREREKERERERERGEGKLKLD